MANTCVNLAKFSLVLNVLLFFVGGGVLILVGSLIIDNADGAGDIVKSTYIMLPSIIMLIAGLFMLALGFVGCFACLKQTQCLNNTFFFLMFIIIAVEVVAFGLSVRYRSELEDAVDDYLKDGLVEYNTNSALKNEIDKIQVKFQCCGVDSYEDWFNTTYFRSHSNTFPNSCCSNSTCEYKEEADQFPVPANVFMKGCYNGLKDFFNRYMVYLIVGYGIFILVQATALIATCIISHRARRDAANPYSAFGVQA